MNNDKQLQTTQNKSISNFDEKGQRMSSGMNPYNREIVLENGVKHLEQLKKNDGGSIALTEKDPAFKMMTLFEFENGYMLSCGFGEGYRVMVTDLSQQLQNEYDCKTPSEKATAHLASQNYVRTLELQRYINLQLDRETYSDLSTHRLAVLQKALDQANKHYLQSIQVLRSLKQPALNVTVKTVTANIANQQLIQENHEKA